MDDSPLLLDLEDSLVVMVDVQENHYPTVADGDGTLERLVRLLRAARVLGAHMVWTEHYPRAFGPTLAPVAAALDGLTPIPKTCFGCFGEPRFAAAVEAAGRNTLVICGTETHICIQQTALQALGRGQRVAVVADCVTARGIRDHDIALRRLERSGAVLVTWEALVYEWMRGAGHPQFKKVLPLVKGQ